MAKLVKKIKISTTIELITGLHIGGSKDSVEIGGVDNPVIKISRGKDFTPYIPGSSLKGKMRCLLEQIRGAELGESDEINNMFGSHDAKNPSPSKIIFRDSYLSPESEQVLLNNDNMDMPFTEVKYENSIDRVKGVAQNPRQTERVPAGAIFNVEIILNVWDTEREADMMALLNEGIKALENDYLGGSGSRGYGQIKFGEIKKEYITFDNE